MDDEAFNWEEKGQLKCSVELSGVGRYGRVNGAY